MPDLERRMEGMAADPCGGVPVPVIRLSCVARAGNDDMAPLFSNVLQDRQLPLQPFFSPWLAVPGQPRPAQTERFLPRTPQRARTSAPETVFSMADDLIDGSMAGVQQVPANFDAAEADNLEDVGAPPGAFFLGTTLLTPGC